MIVKDLILDVLKDIWPTIVIASVILISLRITYLIKKHKKAILYKELLSLAFILYTLCLFHIVTYHDVSLSASNYVPFKEITRYSFGSEQFIKNIIGNIIMFIPYGFFASYFLENKKSLVAVVLTIIVTVTIEFIQSHIGRVFDIDDVILNTIGGLVGFYLYIFMEKIKGSLPKALKKDWVINIFVIALIILAIIISFDIDILKLY